MSLDPNTWTLKTQEAVNAAIELASTSDNPEVTPDHLLVTLISQDNGVVLPVIRKIGLNPLSLRNRTEESLARLPKAYGTDTSISKELTGIFQEATKQRGELKCSPRSPRCAAATG
jgi:ATP-dependent Clp protease ATP-binding subunit ClpB